MDTLNGLAMIRSSSKEVVRYRHESNSIATYIESSFFRFRDDHKRDVNADGSRASKVHVSKVYFAFNYTANLKRISSLTDIAESRNRHIRDIRTYRVAQVLENISQVDEHNTKEVADVVKTMVHKLSYELSSVVKERINEDTISEDDPTLRDHYNTIISEKRIQRLERSDIKKTALLLIDRCDTPKAMQIIDTFVRHLLANNYITRSGYQTILAAFKFKGRVELKMLLERMNHEVKNNSDFFNNPDDFVETIAKIKKYQNLLMRFRHNYPSFRRYITTAAPISQSQRLLNLAEKEISFLLREVSDKIRKTCKNAVESNSLMFFDLVIAFKLAVNLVNDRDMLKIDRANFETYLQDTSKYFIAMLSNIDERHLRDEHHLREIESVLLKSDEIAKKNSKYPNIREILTTRYSSVMDKINQGLEALEKKKKQRELYASHMYDRLKESKDGGSVGAGDDVQKKAPHCDETRQKKQQQLSAAIAKEAKDEVERRNKLNGIGKPKDKADAGGKPKDKADAGGKPKDKADAVSDAQKKAPHLDRSSDLSPSSKNEPTPETKNKLAALMADINSQISLGSIKLKPINKPKDTADAVDDAQKKAPSFDGMPPKTDEQKKD